MIKIKLEPESEWVVLLVMGCLISFMVCLLLFFSFTYDIIYNKPNFERGVYILVYGFIALGFFISILLFRTFTEYFKKHQKRKNWRKGRIDYAYLPALMIFIPKLFRENWIMAGVLFIVAYVLMVKAIHAYVYRDEK